MEKYILDTNLFFNMEADLGLGKKTEEIIINLTNIISRLKKEKKAEFFMPPSIVSEFLGFFPNKEQLFLKNFLSIITIKSPEKSKISFPSTIFYRLIEDIRTRSYRGLNISEEEIESAGRSMMKEKDLGKKDFQIKIGATIKNFRNRYRNATRTGFLDSIADLDLIVLAIEQGAFLISTDEGVLNWGRLFGVKEMPSLVFQKRLEALL
ncbi:MAG: RNA ligase partner protein [Candidatus Roizmanbacteria bacterium]